MPVNRLVVVVSGLPGAGKTTLGRALATALNLPFFDKDDLLESLFDSLGVASSDERRRLSRASDTLLRSLTEASSGAVICSFWRRPSMSDSSGTPTAWLANLPATRTVEVLCECPPAVALDRFENRRRHPGHLDGRRERSTNQMSEFEFLAAQGPLGLGRVLVIDTTSDVDVVAVAVANSILNLPA